MTRQADNHVETNQTGMHRMLNDIGEITAIFDGIRGVCNIYDGELLVDVESVATLAGMGKRIAGYLTSPFIEAVPTACDAAYRAESLFDAIGALCCHGQLLANLETVLNLASMGGEITVDMLELLATQPGGSA